jgi:Ca-activated chloride channel family protein
VVTEFITIAVAFVALAAEAIHLRRIKKVSHLAFGPRGRPRRWTWIAPVVRVLGLSAMCWGFLSLILVVESRVHNSEKIDDNDYKHLVLILDVSPSMHLKDAGPEQNRTRRQRASEVLESLFNRIPMREYKTSVIAVYTDAKPLLEDSKDYEVVRHILEELPMWHAFDSGKTKLMDGINYAAKLAKPWNPKSTFVVMLTDGDTVPATGMPKMPAAVAEFVVIGIGDSNSGRFIDGHQSRQDTNTLRQIAHRLNGIYHNGNQKHLTSQIVSQLSHADQDDSIRNWTRREWALVAILVGAVLFSFIPILLHYFGSAFYGGVPLKKSQKMAA